LNLLYGLVLAGGRSSRFGSDKALARLNRVSLLETAVNHLSLNCREVAVSAPPGSGAAELADSLGLVVLHDRPGDVAGPLAGVRAGLTWAGGCGGEWLATVPCDAPLLPADIVARLLEALDEAPAAVAETEEGVEPLCAVWKLSALDALEAELADGRHPPVHQVLERLGAARVGFPDPGLFLNVNTPEDLALAAVLTAAP
jgi:molybdopterin-guanine dinucleotide biosynthesis protein A